MSVDEFISDNFYTYEYITDSYYVVYFYSPKTEIGQLCVDEMGGLPMLKTNKGIPLFESTFGIIQILKKFYNLQTYSIIISSSIANSMNTIRINENDLK
jgi:hypothetical protein